MKLIAHCLVKNEERFIWYAINSVIDFVDEIMVWDQGSSDKTIDIINSINSKKIKFRKVEGSVADLRQRMLDDTTADWILVLDGDEVWYKESLSKLKSAIQGDASAELVVVPNYMLVGDMYHHQENVAGKYKIGRRMGHYNIRLIKRNIADLKVFGEYPAEGYSGKNGVKIQDFPEDKILFFDNKYIHASFLPRSTKDIKKIKYEIGEEFPKDFYYPEVFFEERPGVVPSVWGKMSFKNKLTALVETPLKKIRRRLV